MRLFIKPIGENGACLTCYIQDYSSEMPNLVSRPAVLIIPGGAYRICSDREAEPVALAYVYSGFNAFVLRYTNLASGTNESVFPQALSEAEEALEYIRSHAEELRVEPGHVAAVGFSAGGHLAAALGTLGRIRPDALVLGYAVVTDALKARGMVLPNLLEYVDGSTPPAFLFATQGDRLVDAAENSLAFAALLARAGVPYEIHIYAKGDHGLSLANETVCGGNGLEDADVARWLPMSARFLRQVWSGEPLSTGAGTAPKYDLRTRVEFFLCRPFSAAPVERFLPDIRSRVAANPKYAALSLGEYLEITGDLPSEELPALEAAVAAIDAQ